MKLEQQYKMNIEKEKSIYNWNRENISSYINVVVFFLIVISFLVLSFFIKNGGYSEYEKRNLTEFPKINTTDVKTFFSGEYFKKIESFYSDNFPFREEFLNFSAKLGDIKGSKKDEIKIY